ncbi:hypothetical protein LC653_45195 [Nostoc sp. CHAB 5784]|uniref:hypothetical protein n=1 Tax=Nostoc mirabile TaxID=2907820 RepID=UPI001E5288D3|nr:hypothetical protein [Nostoc mirabile]MCC5670764.1 hypothetical protein [Nostoc mirabile CHAB5784]
MPPFDASVAGIRRKDYTCSPNVLGEGLGDAISAKFPDIFRVSLKQQIIRNYLNYLGLTQELRNNEPQRRREASAPLRFPDLKQLARHGEIRV